MIQMYSTYRHKRISLTLCSTTALMIMCGCPAWAQNAQPADGQLSGAARSVTPAFLPQNGSPHPNFSAAAQNAIPITPGMIRALQHRYDGVSKAIADAHTSPMAIPVTSTVTIGLGPQSVTNIIETAYGFPTAVAFLDSSGAPWPIAWTTNSNPAPGSPTTKSDTCVNGGNPATAATAGTAMPAIVASGFIVCVPYKGSNVLEISPRSRYPRGGLLVNLKGAAAPLPFLILTNSTHYEARLDVQINQRGPDASPEVYVRSNAPETGAPALTAMLNGEPPADAVPLGVIGASPEAIRAWRYRGQIYIRTRDKILSPEWDGSEYGPDGVGIYVVPNTPVVLMSGGDGRTFSVSFKED
ncbi:DotH/IcmK family type IV secretion protein [Acidiphilium acidophilum]|jgi:intracellular multiplication protein IcmK|uniref:DotH/IcmK family type IV secretion protein n=1 Tax=Acidiphilium acidophilum TaxID=76588 RepID=A0AAW9DLB1_ACIAO|nr:DotH/IcmK family type IV secretion protein [Acidiphilium acidophilum]MDX5929167.1 DotH/IcmK family type IV secretion protein [Acidiphilium acidophilum]